MHRFTPGDTGFSLFLLDKNRRQDAEGLHDDWDSPVPCWRTPQPIPHAHEDHEINLVVSGAARYVWDGEQQTLVSVGQMFVIPGGVSHIVEVDNHAVVRGLWLHPTLFRPLAAGHPPAGRLTEADGSLPPRLAGDAGLFQTLLELFGQSQSEYARSDDLRTESLRAIGRSSAIALLRLMQSQARTHEDAPSLRRVQSVKSWMDRNYLEEIRLPALARMASLSPSQFSEIFHQAVGTSPMAYLTQRRVNQAQDLLATTDLTVTSIAGMTGFDHLSNFNHLFKAHVGLTPSAYRKKHENDRDVKSVM